MEAGGRRLPVTARKDPDGAGRPGLPRSDGYREPAMPAYSRRAGVASTRVLTTTVLAA